MDARKRLGARIKQLRRVRGVTQEQPAERMEINPKYRSSIERGTENPTFDLFCRLAEGLQVELDELFQFNPDASQPEQLRQRLAALIAESTREELPRLVRVVEALLH